MDQKIWFRTADMFFDLAHSLTDSIAKGHPLYKPAIRMDDLVKTVIRSFIIHLMQERVC